MRGHHGDGYVIKFKKLAEPIDQLLFSQKKINICTNFNQMITDPQEIGNRLKILRGKVNMTQLQVSKAIESTKIDQNTVARAEQGGTKIETFLILVNFYNEKLYPTTFDILANTLVFHDNLSGNNLASERLQMLKQSLLDNALEIDDISLLLDSSNFQM